MKIRNRLNFSPGDGMPLPVKAAVAIYWIGLIVFLIRLALLQSFVLVDDPLTAKVIALGFLAVVILFEAFALVKLSYGTRWARNVALLSSALAVVSSVYGFTQTPTTTSNDFASLASVVTEAVAALLLLSSSSTAWFKARR